MTEENKKENIKAELGRASTALDASINMFLKIQIRCCFVWASHLRQQP
jgi:hypothetical protein